MHGRKGMTKRYDELREGTVRALQQRDGWKAARYTHEAVDYLRHKERTGKVEAWERWAADLGRARFSATSARRYWTVWEKWGVKEARLVDFTGKELSFGEHYAVVRGGGRALDVIDEARKEGRGVHAAVQQLRAVEPCPAIRLAQRTEAYIDGLIELDCLSELDNGDKEFLLAWVDEMHQKAAEVKRLIK